MLRSFFCWRPSWDKGSQSPHCSFSPDPSPIVLLLGCPSAREQHVVMKSVFRNYSKFLCFGVWSWPQGTQAHSPPALGSACCLPSLCPLLGPPLAPSSAFPQDAPLIQGFGPYSPWPRVHQQESPAPPNFMEMSNSEVSILRPHLIQCKKF